VFSLLFDIARTMLRFDGQLEFVNAAFPLLQMIKDFKMDKSFVPPVAPGSESAMANPKPLEELRVMQRTCFQLCTALNQFLAINIYSHQLVPREFLRDKLVHLLERFTSKAFEREDAILRPVVFEGN